MLVLAHVLSGAILGYFGVRYFDGGGNIPQILEVACIGLLLSQTSLLGLWVGLATPSWPVRLLAFLIGTSYLSFQLCFSVSRWDVFYISLIILSTLAVTAIMLVTRRFTAQIMRLSDAEFPSNVEGLRFSIRHLLLLTLFINITLMAGRLLQPFSGSVELFTICVCSASVGSASAWAMLGRGNLFLRSSIVFIIGLLMACILTFFLGGAWWFWNITMVLESACLLCSLYVVRQCGFRLVHYHSAKN